MFIFLKKIRFPEKSLFYKKQTKKLKISREICILKYTKQTNVFRKTFILTNNNKVKIKHREMFMCFFHTKKHVFAKKQQFLYFFKKFYKNKQKICLYVFARKQMFIFVIYNKIYEYYAQNVKNICL